MASEGLTEGPPVEGLSEEGAATLREGFENTVHVLEKCGVFTVEGHWMAPMLLHGMRALVDLSGRTPEDGQIVVALLTIG